MKGAYYNEIDPFAVSIGDQAGLLVSVTAAMQEVGGVALALYLLVIWRSLQAAMLSKDRLGAFLVLGVLASFSFQVFYNMECGRYAMYCGEPVLTGFMRCRPGPMFWVGLKE